MPEVKGALAGPRLELVQEQLVAWVVWVVPGVVWVTVQAELVARAVREPARSPVAKAALGEMQRDQECLVPAAPADIPMEQLVIGGCPNP